MKLIIGGAYQGKRRYAMEHFGQENLICDFHLFILELVKRGELPVEYIKSRLDDYSDKVIICDDISSGVVPTDPLLRAWREAVGHTLALIASESDEVVRVFCGLGMRLK